MFNRMNDNAINKESIYQTHISSRLNIDCQCPSEIPLLHKNLQKENKQTLKNHTKSCPILMKFEVEVDHFVWRLW